MRQREKSVGAVMKYEVINVVQRELLSANNGKMFLVQMVTAQ